MPFVLTLRPDNIIHVNVTTEEAINADHFFNIIYQLRKFNKAHNTTFPCIITASENIQIEKEVKDLLKSKLFKNYTSAGAIVTLSEPQHMFVNVFLGLSQLKSPVRSFKTKERALIWLQQFVAN